MPETLSIRKTLVLGLGTTGKEVAERVAEHLTWQFGSFERAAWVRLLVLETAQPTSFLGDRVLHGGIKHEEYAPYLNSPRSTGSEFGFYDWQDGPSLNAITNPATGAGNLRMLGRLCLFHPATYTQLQTRVIRDISELKQLTPQTVADKLGQPGLNVQIHSDTVIYVVGTLCGGTCSGGAADLGYLLDIWSNSGINRQAIFTLPHPGLNRAEAPRYKKNAYYALKELNHYQLSSTTWEQKLPGFDTPFRNNRIPYDILRVVMPPGPAPKDVADLNVMIGQYLAAAVGPAGATIAENDVNALGKMTSTESIGFMRPLFSTMGVAALEYPGEHIQRAATNRLLSATYQRWCQHQIDSDMFDSAMRLLGGTDFNDLLQRLTQDADKMSVAVFQQTFRPPQEGMMPKVDQVRQLLREVDGRLQATALPQEGSASAALPSLLQVMQQNHQRFLTNIERDVQRFVTQSLFDLEGGPGFVREVLKQYLRNMEEWALTAQQNIQEYQQDARSMRQILEEQIAELERIQNARMMFGKREKLQHGWEAVTGSVQSYLETEMRTQAINHLQRRNLIQEMVEHYRRITAVTLRRLEQMQAAFSQEATELERRWKEMASFSPGVNGRVYFEAEPPSPRGTITEEYFNILRQVRWPNEPVTGWDDSQKEEAAQKDVLHGLEALSAELTREDGSSAFDPRPGVQSAKEMIPSLVRIATEDKARSIFVRLRDQVHIADKAAEADIDTVIQLSEPKLGISASQVSNQLAGTRGVEPAKQDLAFMDLGANNTTLRPNVERVVNKVQNRLSVQRGGITNSHDPFRLLLIREKHGFTLGQMESVVRANSDDKLALQSAEHCSDFNFWHTRRDVDWTDPLIPPTRLEAMEEAWLLVLLLGRAEDGVLEWTPANKKEIEPEGWYKVASGEFRVFYPPNMLDVSEREAPLSLSFREAVAKLMLPENALLNRCLNLRFTVYRDKQGADKIVSTLDAALASLPNLSVKDLERKQAERILRRTYRRDESLTRAFFNLKTKDMENGRAEFAHLWHTNGEENYTADAYYCPQCNSLLGNTVQRLLEGMFRCPACNTDKRYWP